MRERFLTPQVFGKLWRLHRRPVWWVLGSYRTLREQFRRLRDFLRPPDYRGLRLTPKRLLNLYLVRLQKGLGSLHLYGSPIKLTIEASNACNLRCPYCFTGAGEVGRQKTMLQMPLYKKALDELGDRLFVVEFYNWGEPLLNKNIFEMIRIASDRKVSTMISTNFSLPFDEERAEKLVESRLAVLGVSLDGAWQESYEQYRVGGNLETILRNVRLVNEAKRKANSKYPHMIWEYHIFSHNRTSEEIETARRMAQELDMEFALSKGWVAGKDWDTNKEFADPDHKPDPGHCEMLWQQAVINGEGGVAPCCAAYYKEDDFGLFSDGTSVPLSELATQPFRSVWNNENFREARKLFRTRVNASPLGRSLICYDCPITVIWDQYKRHRALGLPPDRFEYGFDPNDGFNYFFDRRPPRDQSKKNGVAPADVIELTPAAKP